MLNFRAVRLEIEAFHRRMEAALPISIDESCLYSAGMRQLTV